MKALLAAGLLGLAGAALADEAVLRVDASEPRAYGYQVGDHVQRRVTVEVPRGSGSGFVWDGEGHVVTNFHVVEGADALTVTLADGTTHEARVVGDREAAQHGGPDSGGEPAHRPGPGAGQRSQGGVERHGQPPGPQAAGHGARDLRQHLVTDGVAVVVVDALEVVDVEEGDRDRLTGTLRHR